MANSLFFIKYNLVFLLIYLWHSVNGHPQCLDSRPPFQSHGSLSFCTDYEDFGCCTRSDDEVLRNRYRRIESVVSTTLWEACSHYAKTFLCQTCSPYAAHIFDSEQSHNSTEVVQRVFPGLCRDQCSTFYQQCKELITPYMEEVKNEDTLEEQIRLENAYRHSESSFCSAILLSDNDYCYPELLTNPILNGNISIEKVTGEGCICLQPFEAQFRNPVFLKHTNDGTDRLFIGEQIGLVHIMYTNGTLLPYPFLDIQYDIMTTQAKGDERGLLGMEFHPNFTSNGKLYIYYSTHLNEYEVSQNFGDHKIRIEELRVNLDFPDEIDVYYSRVILEVYQPWWNHNGGELLFGDDGYLYIFIGDGGRAGDPLNSGQDMFSMLGKVHRIDVNKIDPVRKKEYSIPPDNPFADGIKGLPEIYAFGVRNIWRCGKDRGDRLTKHGKGRIVCGDVGQGAVEEINLLKKGANYGWKLKEGTSVFCSTCQQALREIPLTEPIWDYPHAVGKSVTGGHFYRGCESPNFNGFYFYGDFMSGRIFRLTEPKNPKQKRWDNKEINMCGSNMCKPPFISDYSTSIISFGEDEAGEIYMLSTSYPSATSYSGSVYKLVDPSRRGNPDACKNVEIPTTSTTIPTTTSTSIKTETTTPFKPVFPTKPVVRDNSGSSVTIAPFDKRLMNYLDYYKKHRRRNNRRNFQTQFKQENRRQQWKGRTYATTPPTKYVKDSRQKTISKTPRKDAISKPPQLIFHGINIQRCKNDRCSLRKIMPQK
ncbi:hypothetical protein ACF0H5_002291 [Mactra antiquata]